jgi:putative drug exporter of the RND superfamily
MGLANLLAERHIDRPEDAFVGITGAIPARAEQRDQISDALPLVELMTLLVVVGAVGLHFRALLAPLINLAGIALAYLLAVRVTAAVAQAADVSIPSEVQPVIVVLLFGIMTDYAIFFLSRARRHLGEGLPRLDAARRTTEEMTGIVLTAGLAVAGASAALGVADLGFLRAFGPGMSLSVLIALAVALTFTPAALALSGRATFWPSRAREEPLATEAARTERAAPHAPRRVRSRAMRMAAGRPWVTIGACLLLLGVAAANSLRLETGQTLIRGLPDDAEARVAAEAAERAFVPGILSPTELVVEAPGIAGQRRQLWQLQTAIERRASVAGVLGPRDQPLERQYGAVYSPSRNAARFAVIFRSDPLGAGSIEALRQLRLRLPSLLTAQGLGDAQAMLAGDTALAEETVTRTAENLGRVGPVALMIVLVVLAAFLRALIAPLYLVAASMISVAASIGLTVLLFQDVLGYGELTFYVPFAGAVLLLALGSDYNIFIAGRIWAEARVRPLREAVLVAGSRAATPITVAGLVLAASFALLAIVPVRPFRELAFMMSAGLLLDAFVVRTLLVPAMIAASGRFGSWPSRRDREPATGAGVEPEPI